MTEPEEILMEGAQAVVPDLPALPAPAGAPQVPVEAPVQPSRVLLALRNAWRKLTSPTDKVPADYRDRLVSRAINQVVDKGGEGPAHDAQVGEAVHLAASAMMVGGGDARTPLGHLLVAGETYAGLRMTQAAQPLQASEQA